jgi:hypothetical protein
MVKVVLFPGGRQTPMRVNLRLTPCGALSRHRCRGVRLRKHARLYYKMPADGPGGRLDLLVDPSSNLSTKYTFPAYISFRELACMPHTVSRSRSRALLGTVGQYFIVPFGTRGCRPKGSLYRGGQHQGGMTLTPARYSVTFRSRTHCPVLAGGRVRGCDQRPFFADACYVAVRFADINLK